MAPTHFARPRDEWQKHYDAGLRALSDFLLQGAEAELRTALSIAETSGLPDRYQLDTLNSLVQVLDCTFKDADAEVLYRRLLLLHERLLAPNSDETIRALEQLAKLCMHQGKYSEAEEFTLRRLNLRQNAYGPEHPSVADALDFLAGVRAAEGRLSEASEHYRDSLAIRERTLGQRHLQVADSLMRLACHLRATDEREASALLQRAVGIYEELLEQRSYLNESEISGARTFLKIALENLARRAFRRGQYVEAEQLFCRVVELARAESVFSAECFPFPPEMFISILVHHKKYAKAEQLLKDVTAGATVRGSDFWHCLGLLAQLYAVQGRASDAEPLFQQTIDVCEERKGGPYAFLLIGLLESYAELCRRTGRLDAASWLDVRAKQARAERADKARARNRPTIELRADGWNLGGIPLESRIVPLARFELLSDSP